MRSGESVAVRGAMAAALHERPIPRKAPRRCGGAWGQEAGSGADAAGLG